MDRVSDMGALRLIEKRVMISLRSLQMRREEHLMHLAQRSVLPVYEVRRLGRRIGEITEASLTDMVQRSATECAGRSELQIFDWMKRAAAGCIHSLRTEVEKLDAKE